MLAPIQPGSLPGAWRDLPTYVGGRTFSSLAAFKKETGSGHAILRPGQSVSIKMPLLMGATVPNVTGFNKSSPFSAKYANGKLTLTAKPGARMGAVDRVTINQGPLVAPNLRPNPIKTNVTLEVGLGRIRLG